MTPIQAAVKAGRESMGDYPNLIGEEDARAIITAFLDAAAGDVVLCERVGDAAYAQAYVSLTLSGKDAIRRLKEAVNG